MDSVFETKLLKYKKHIIQVLRICLVRDTSISTARHRLILLIMQRE